MYHPTEKSGKHWGLFRTFLSFWFLGCIYPAIDLLPMKRKSTLETILVTPVKRLEILFGKMIVVSLTGLVSAILSIVGLSVGLKQFSKALPQTYGHTIELYRTIQCDNACGYAHPSHCLFAGIMTLITTYAKSYKEAQALFTNDVSYNIASRCRINAWYRIKRLNSHYPSPIYRLLQKKLFQVL